MRFTALILVLVLVGCSSTRQATDIRESGFLPDYSILRDGDEKDFARVYWNDEVNFANYDKFILDPVTIWISDNAKLKDVPQMERQELADFFYSSLNSSLKQEYESTDHPEEGTLRIRAAITEAGKSNIYLDTISTFSWQVRILTEAAAVNREMAFFTGQAAVEIELMDAVTGQLIGAGVGHRVGRRTVSKDLTSTFKKWDDARAAYETWAEQLRGNLKARRERILEAATSTN